MRALVWILAAGCGFHSPSAQGDDVGAAMADAGADPGSSAARDIPHVPAAFELPGTSDLVLANGTLIDTTMLTIGPAAEAMVDAVGQEPGGPELMLIRARSVTIPSGAVVRATGSRPLVILADRIVIAGTLDAAGHLGKAGPNGGTPATPSSMGTGGNGDHQGLYSDSGGGGGSYGAVAGVGGKGSTNAGACSPTTSGGPAGASWGNPGLDELRGGAAGGQGSAAACAKAVPGAGGGAVQLSALARITVEAGGVLHVGGGGGGGGINCGVGSDTGAGSGGGAGGALLLDAPELVLGGVLAANGGAGGGGGSSPGTTGTAGGDALAASAPAQGGTGGGSYGARGGNGAAGSVQAANGSDNSCDGNGGGGGGGVGRIVLRVPAAAAITSGGVASPTPTIVTY